jgi:DNA polymerase I-like protein with 3'-5' exonuclease and polymerase domains
MTTSIIPTIQMSMELTKVLADIEMNGLHINTEILNNIKIKFEKELVDLQRYLNEKVKIFMGDTPINLDSPEDRSILFYSMRVTDKKMWATRFNIGYEERGNTRKPKRRTNFANINDFYVEINSLARAELKTHGSICHNCEGTGKYTYMKKDGTPSNVKRHCKTCGTKGLIFKNTDERAGLRLKPRNVIDCSAMGFKTDKVVLESYLSTTKGVVHEFLKRYVRYSAIRTYLRTFVDGMQKAISKDGMVHPQFMQCVTSTGRLSSRNPNFQNMPRGNTFPVRECVTSRWEGGKILEGDYSQLEFRVAGFLANDEQVLKDIKNKVDVHSYTAKILGVSRQKAKSDTFKPLYGGILGTPKQMQYYRAFKNKYSGISRWHTELQNEALMSSKIRLPSGRQYFFPNVERLRSGSVTNSTAIKNYPVQGFATADLLPLALINLNKLLTKNELKSIVCNTVHDSIVLDVYPDEDKQAIETLKEAMLSISDECEKRYGFKYTMPIGIELKIGDDWLNMKEVYNSDD